MKKTIRAFALLLALILALGTAPIMLAEELWKEDYYRAYDVCQVLSEEERDDIDEECLAFMQEYETDLVFITLAPGDYEGDSLQDVADYVYENAGFGYGRTRDAFVMTLDVEEPYAEFFTYGRAGTLLSADELSDIAEIVVGYQEEYGVWGVLYGAKSMITKTLEGKGVSPTGAAADPSARVGEGSSMPAWYPVDPQNFPLYYDEEAPRVVDDADIFTDEQEAAMEARLAEIRADIQKDIVVFTDMSTHGLSRAVYAADFYDFNGYGIGPEHEGVVLFICMDPNDRGGWVCCTGSETMGLYTEQVANDMDDVLYDYLGNGEYNAGVRDWIENFRTLYVKGTPFAPYWMPELNSFVHQNDLSAARLVDDADLLTDAEEAQLLTKAAELSSKHGVDIVMHTARSTGGLYSRTYADQYYYYNNYGFGENYDGILLVIFKQGSTVYSRVSAEGAGAINLTDVNLDRLESRTEGYAEDGQYYKAFDWWLCQVDHMRRTGRVSRSIASWGIWTAIEAAVASIVGGIGLGSAKSKMRTPTVKTNANAYVAADGVGIRSVRDDFINTTITRRYDPVKTKSSGGGGGSSYSSSYHGSSGSSHSGSGRSF